MCSPASLAAGLNRFSFWRRRTRVWDFTLTAPTFDRWLYLWLHVWGRLGSEERDIFARLIQPGMHVADVGANIGLYSLLFSRLVGPAGAVYAFEPDALMNAALTENVAANDARQIEVSRCAVGAVAGEAVLRRHALNSGDNRLGTARMPAQSGEARVKVRTLSDLLAGRRVDFVKMDVQGWEGEVLRGMRSLLEANPGLTIYFEFWPAGLDGAGTGVAGLADVIRDLGLRVWHPGDRSVPVIIEELARTMKRRAYVNLLAAR